MTTVMALVKEPSVAGVEIPPCLLLVLLAVSTDRTGTVGTVFFLPFEVPEFGRQKIDVLLISQYAHNKIWGISRSHHHLRFRRILPTHAIHEVPRYHPHHR